MPVFSLQFLPDSSYPLWRCALKQGIQHICVVFTILTTAVQYALNVVPALPVLDWLSAGSYARKAAFIVRHNTFNSLHFFDIELVLPFLISRKCEKLAVIGRLVNHRSCILLEHIRKVRQTLYIGVHLFPVRIGEEFLKLLLEGRLVPRTATLALFKQALVFQELALGDSLSAEIFRKIRLHTALGRVYFQTGEDSKCFRFLTALVTKLVCGVLIVCDYASVKRGVGYLSHARRKRALDRFKTRLPVGGITDNWFSTWYFQQRSFSL